MRKNFINKILMLFEVSHSFYFILHKPMDGGIGGKRSRESEETETDRGDEKVNTIGLFENDEDDIGVHSYGVVCVCVCLGFSFSWPASSAFRMLCTPSVLCIVCVYLFAAFLAIQIFRLHFFRFFVFITLILTFLFLHSPPFFVHEYLWEFFWAAKRVGDNHTQLNS